MHCMMAPSISRVVAAGGVMWGAELGLRRAHPQCCQPHIKLRLQTVWVLEMQVPYYRRLAIRCDMARYRPKPGSIEPPPVCGARGRNFLSEKSAIRRERSN
jgi:hypothetical protein